MQKTWEKENLTSVWNAQHSNAGQNIQQFSIFLNALYVKTSAPSFSCFKWQNKKRRDHL